MDSPRSTKKQGSSFELIASSEMNEFGSGPTKVCNTCGVEKPLAEYHRDRLSPDRHKLMCKSCKGKYDRKRSKHLTKIPSGDFVRQAFEDAAYRILKESM